MKGKAWEAVKAHAMRSMPDDRVRCYADSNSQFGLAYSCRDGRHDPLVAPDGMQKVLVSF